MERGDLRVGTRVREVDRYQTPSLRSDSHELKSQPKNALIVSVVSRNSCASSRTRSPSPASSDRAAARRGGSARGGSGDRARCTARSVERMHRGLQVHQALAALLVALAQRCLVGDAADRAPAAAVVRLHEHRVADLVPDRAEVEQLRVRLERRRESAVASYAFGGIIHVSGIGIPRCIIAQ